MRTLGLLHFPERKELVLLSGNDGNIDDNRRAVWHHGAFLLDMHHLSPSTFRRQPTCGDPLL